MQIAVCKSFFKTLCSLVYIFNEICLTRWTIIQVCCTCCTYVPHSVPILDDLLKMDFLVVVTWNWLIFLEAAFFKKGVLTTFWPFFCFQSNLDQTQSDCSTHEYYNLTKFGQDWTENKKLLSACKILAGPLLKFLRL